MNAFDYKILSESYKPNYESLAKLCVKQPSFLEEVLEFNESINAAEIESSRKFYRAMLESDVILHEGVIGSLIELIGSVIEKIFDFIASIFGGGSGSSSSSGGGSSVAKTYDDKFDELKKEYDELKKDFRIDTVDKSLTESIYDFEYPEHIVTENHFKVHTSVKSIAVNALRNAKADKDNRASYVDKIKKCADELSMAIDEVKEQDLKNEDALKKVVNPDKKDVNVYDYLLKEINNHEITSKDPTIQEDKYNKLFQNVIKDLEDEKKSLEASQKNDESMAEVYTAYRQYITTAISYIQLLMNDTASYYRNRAKVSLGKLKQLNRLMKLGSKGKVSEAYDFDDAYSAALDEAFLLNDYCLSEELSKIEYQRIAQEAMIFASDKSYSDKLNEIASLNEAVKDKIKKAYYNTIAAIKKIFAKFMEKLRGNFTTTKHYLDKYKNIILKQTFVSRTYTTREIIPAMQKTLNVGIPALNYGALKDSLADPVSFFKSNYFGQINNGFKGAELSDIAEHCKNYFLGAESKEYNSKEIQDNIKDIYDYMYDISKIEKNLKKSIDDIETNVNNALKQAGVSINNPDYTTNSNASEYTSDNGSGTATQTSTGSNAASYESAYSAIFGTVLTEVEKTDVVAPQNNTNGTAANDNSMTGKMAASMNNVGKRDETDNAHKGTQRPIVETQLKVYTDVCTTVLKAKLTAIEFMRSEFMQIIRWHVQDYIGDQTEERNDEATNRIKPNNNQ